MNPVISIIVATYNQEGTIARALDSVLMQKCHVPYEIVVGEDCSTDGTLAICREYERQHPDIVRVIANCKNKGIVNNYFDCILAAKGDYIADCAGDDFWTDALKLEKEITIIEQNRKVTLVHTPWYYYDENSGLRTESSGQPFTDAITSGRQMLESIIVQTQVPVIQLCTSLYRRDIVIEELQKDEYMFRNPEFGCEDLQISFVMAMYGDIAYIPERMLNYSVGHESVSCSSSYQKQYRFTKRVSSLSHYIAKKYGFDSECIREYFQLRVYALYMHALRAHDKALVAETEACEKEWKVERNRKISFLYFVLQHDFLWTLALAARKVFVSAKQLLR